MKITKVAQRASWEPVGDSRKCPKCNGWKKKQRDGPAICPNCYFREKAKEEEAIKEASPLAPPKTNVRIGKL